MTWSSPARPALATTPTYTVVGSFNPINSGSYAIDATFTYTTAGGSGDVGCYLRDHVSSRSGNFYQNSTPETYEFATNSYFRTLAMTGILSTSRSTNVQLVCTKFISRSTHGIDENIVGVKLTSARTVIRPRHTFSRRAPAVRQPGAAGTAQTRPQNG